MGAGATQWEYKVDCGGTVGVIGAGGTVPITGNGTHRLSHRANDGVSWTEWTDHFVRIDATVPANTTIPPTTAWQKGPVNVALTGTDATSLVHTEWRVGGGSWTTGNSATVTGTGTHQLESAAVDEAGNRTERNDTVKVDDTLPSDTTVTPVGWQNGPVNVTVNGTDAALRRRSRRVAAQRAADRLRPRRHRGPHRHPRPAQLPHACDRRGRQRERVGRPRRVGRHPGPGRHDRDPDRLAHHPVDPDQHHRRRQRRLGHQAHPVAARRRHDRRRLEHGHDAGDRHAATVSTTLEVRITDNQDRVLDWHTHQVKIDTVNPVDNTTVAAGWLPLEYFDVLVRGTDAHSLVQGVEWRLDGGDIETASSNNYEVRVSGNGVHTLETRIVDNAGRRSGWKAHTVKLDAGLPTNTTPTVPAGWRNTPYAVTLNGTDGGSDVASVNYRIELEGQPAGAELEGTRNVTQVSITTDGTHTLSTRVLDNAGNYSTWRAETVRIDRVLPTDGTSYPGAPVGNRHVVTFNPQDDRSGAAGVEWKLDGGAVQTAPTATITGAGAHTLSVRVQDNAGNWSAWADHTITVQLGLDTTAPTDTTVVPVHLAGRRGHDPGHRRGRHRRHRRRLRPVGATAMNATRQGPSGSEFTITADGEHEIETRAFDGAGNASAWRSQTLRIDTTPPTDTSTVATGWTNSRAFTVSATDATSASPASSTRSTTIRPSRSQAPPPSRSRPTATTASATARSTTRARPRAGRSTSSASTRSTRATPRPPRRRRGRRARCRSR